jgi:hypothetical protein
MAFVDLGQLRQGTRLIAAKHRHEGLVLWLAAMKEDEEEDKDEEEDEEDAPDPEPQTEPKEISTRAGYRSQ